MQRNIIPACSYFAIEKVQQYVVTFTIALLPDLACKRCSLHKENQCGEQICAFPWCNLQYTLQSRSYDYSFHSRCTCSPIQLLSMHHCDNNNFHLYY